MCAVEGAAGCGKTYRLMEMLAETLEEHPLAKGQRVLALTFMHGARRRLGESTRLDAAEVASIARACRTTLDLSLIRALERP